MSELAAAEAEAARTEPAPPDRLALAAFLGAVVIGGSNFVAIRYSNRELDPLWGAGLRFAGAAVVFGALVRGLRLDAAARPPARRDRALRALGVRRRVRLPLLGAAGGAGRHRRGRDGGRPAADAAARRRASAGALQLARAHRRADRARRLGRDLLPAELDRLRRGLAACCWGSRRSPRPSRWSSRSASAASTRS